MSSNAKPSGGSGRCGCWAVATIGIAVLYFLLRGGGGGATGPAPGYGGPQAGPPTSGYGVPPQAYPQQQPPGAVGGGSIVEVAKATMDQDLRLSETAQKGGRFEVISIYETGDPARPVACVIRFYAPDDPSFAWLYHDATYLYDGVTRTWSPQNVKYVTTFKDGHQQ